MEQLLQQILDQLAAIDRRLGHLEARPLLLSPANVVPSTGGNVWPQATMTSCSRCGVYFKGSHACISIGSVPA